MPSSATPSSCGTASTAPLGHRKRWTPSRASAPTARTCLASSIRCSTSPRLSGPTRSQPRELLVGGYGPDGRSATKSLAAVKNLPFKIEVDRHACRAVSAMSGASRRYYSISSATPSSSPILARFASAAARRRQFSRCRHRHRTWHRGGGADALFRRSSIRSTAPTPRRRVGRDWGSPSLSGSLNCTAGDLGGVGGGQGLHLPDRASHPGRAPRRVGCHTHPCGGG